MNIMWQRWGMILRMSQSCQASPLQQPHHLGQGERSQCGSLSSGGGAVVGFRGRAHFVLFPAWLPGQSREWQGEKHLDCSCGCAEVQWCKPSPWEQLCCPLCSCFLPNFTLLVYDRCRLILRIMKSLFHPSLCSHCMVRCFLQ